MMSTSTAVEATVPAPITAPPVKRRRKQIELTLELDLDDHAKNVFCVKGGSPHPSVLSLAAISSLVSTIFFAVTR